MRKTPRYVRLMSLAVSITAWQLALNLERVLFDNWLNGEDTLPMFDLVSRLSTTLTLIAMANIVWLIIPQRKS